MNTVNPQHPHAASDYRTAMQAAAFAYLERHQAEHLADEQTLFTRAVQHLQLVLDVPQYLAENLVAMAYGELRSADCRLYLDISTSTGRTAIITDPASGLTFAVPVALIVKHLIETPARRTLRQVS
ncbi:conserved protein of unknown function [Pseudomonas marincola]|uniref:Prophage PssSM-01 n=1 Tax=Pseudomonas marincola TaxID=437900 RepID=A0A653E9P2_9PSED|nr:hypothetical protein [Pseudomonas marincola]CAE6923687.1 conserved protein of unknown function [Pseudomonas marincola]